MQTPERHVPDPVNPDPGPICRLQFSVRRLRSLEDPGVGVVQFWSGASGGILVRKEPDVVFMGCALRRLCIWLIAIAG